MDEQKQRRSVSLVGPLILIGLGVIWLLNNMGLLAWSVWETIFRLWPVLLIAVGLEIILNRFSVWGSLLALVVTVVILAGALWLIGANVGTGQVVPGEEVSQALGGATQAVVIIEPGVGSLHIEALPESANPSAALRTSLAEGVIRVQSKQRVRRDFAVSGNTATFSLRGEGETFGPFIGRSDRPSWDLSLAPDVPLELEVAMGIGRADVDLTGLTVSNLKVSMGVGQTIVTLPDEGRFQVKIEGAIGETVVVIPAGMAARIHVNTGLAARGLPASYQHQDDVYTSLGYASADNRVDLEVSQAIGQITVRHTGTR